MKNRFTKLLATLAFIAAAGAGFGAQADETPTTLAGVTLVNAERTQAMMRAGATVYDTRVAAEYAEAHIKGAKSLPYKEKSAKRTDFDKSQDAFDTAKLPADKNAPVVFYCNAGECWKSYKASKIAAESGYRQVHWFRGGLPEWRSKSLPVE